MGVLGGGVGGLRGAERKPWSSSAPVCLEQSCPSLGLSIHVCRMGGCDGLAAELPLLPVTAWALAST